MENAAQPGSGESLSVSAFVLAGGQSRRMGRDKALVTLAGRPLLAHAISILTDAGLSPAIAGARSNLSGFGRVIPDLEPDLGPLSGICAALEACIAAYAVFLPVDMPLLPPSLIGYLVRRAEISGSAVTLASLCGVANPFPVVLRQSVLPLLKSELAAGRRGCLAAFQTAAQGQGQSMSIVPVEVLAQCGEARDARGLPAGMWFTNVNSPDAVGRVERLFPLGIA